MNRGYESYSFKHGRSGSRRLIFALLRVVLITLVLYVITTAVLITPIRMGTASGTSRWSFGASG